MVMTSPPFRAGSRAVARKRPELLVGMFPASAPQEQD
jgi:hypothetical protein